MSDHVTTLTRIELETTNYRPAVTVFCRGEGRVEQVEKTKRCVGCNAVAPPTETNYTLISNQHAWRCAKQLDANGQKVLFWYCATCWKRK